MASPSRRRRARYSLPSFAEADTAFRGEMQLSAMNSINWARIAAQVPYYVAAALAFGETGRSGDVRRATHRLEAPRVNTCPNCGRPKQPHRMCPNCKTYNGREIEPLRTPAP